MIDDSDDGAPIGDVLPESITHDDAERLVDRVLTARARLERIELQAQSVINRASKDLERLEEWALPLLEEYARKNPPRRGKTLHMMTGSLAMRTIPSTVQVDDAEAVIAHVPLVERQRVTRFVDMDALRAYIERTGHVPDGARIQEASERLYVRAVKPRGA